MIAFCAPLSVSASRPVPKVTPRGPVVCSAAVSRRAFVKLLGAAGVSLSAPAHFANGVNAAELLGEQQVDDNGGFSFRVPKEGWTRQTGSLSSFRSIVVYVNDEDGDSNINVVSTPVPGDFQKLTSFGTMDNVLDTLVPRGKKGIDGQVLDSRMDTRKNAYVVEYTISTGGVQRHLLTVFSLQPGRFLNTLTAQATEENWPKREGIMRAVLSSYELNMIN